MDRSDIAEAVVLFQFSNTAMQNVRARTVLQKLQYLYRRNEIGFYTLPRRSLRGTWREGRAGHDLRLNTAYFERIPEANRLAGLSLTLVHEATHATVDFTRLYDEMAARLMPIHYFRELSGPGVFNEANDPPRPGRGPRVVRLPAGSFPEYEEMSEAVRNDQLVDYVLSIRTYTRSSYITPQWIIENLTHWRGLRNRWPSTRGLYIRLLADSVDTYYTRAILDIMESVNRRNEWDEMMREAGPLRSIQLALDDLSARPPYSGRVLALERRWNVYLRERIPHH